MKADADRGIWGIEMTTFLIMIGLVIGVFILINVLSDQKTKLFRRIWSSEALKHQSSHMATSQAEAMDSLIKIYGIVPLDDKAQLRSSITQFLADAALFDSKNQRNMGVQVAPVVARELRKRFPNIAD
ncbi:MAG: hypothetical protein ABI668_13025 [Sphingorhabdus sp.]